MINRIEHKYYEYTVDLELKSKRVLISTAKSGVGKSFMFGILKLYFTKHNIKDVYMYDYQNAQKISEIEKVYLDEDAIVIVDNSDLILDSKLRELLNSSKCQEIYFGRNNKELHVGAANLAELIVDETTFRLEYPFLEEDRI